MKIDEGRRATSGEITDALNNLRRGLAGTGEGPRNGRPVQPENNDRPRKFNQQDWYERAAELSQFGITPAPPGPTREGHSRDVGDYSMGSVGATCVGVFTGGGEYAGNGDNSLVDGQRQHVYGRRAKGIVESGWLKRLISAFRCCPTKSIRNTAILIGLAWFAFDVVFSL